MITPNPNGLRCDGCGQPASAEHIARRLRRLEGATRYRPVHIQTLLLGSVAPREDQEFLYSPAGEFRGEAAQLLRAVGISFEGKSAEAVQAEFQSAGLFLAHLLECPLEQGHNSGPEVVDLLRKHLPAAASRIRRSLKPNSVMLVNDVPQLIVQDVLSVDVGCRIVSDGGKSFSWSSSVEEISLSRFREMLSRPGRT